VALEVSSGNHKPLGVAHPIGGMPFDGVRVASMLKRPSQEEIRK
jgi:hypothetical protein